MGFEKYEAYVRRARSSLVYDPGWSRDNLTGSWRTMRPVFDRELCTECKLCWFYCPESCIAPDTFLIDYDYCKGCGICAEECAPGALRMERQP